MAGVLPLEVMEASFHALYNYQHNRVKILVAMFIHTTTNYFNNNIVI